MGAGVKAAEHGRYTTPTDDVRRRHGLLPPRTGLIYRIMMAHGGVPHSHGELIHRSAWNRNSAKFAFWGFCEVGRARRGPGQPEVTCASRPLCLHASACLVDKVRPTPCPLLSSAAFYIGPHPQPIWSILKPV